jgi:hypothetical protein
MKLPKEIKTLQFLQSSEISKKLISRLGGYIFADKYCGITLPYPVSPSSLTRFTWSRAALPFPPILRLLKHFN